MKLWSFMLLSSWAAACSDRPLSPDAGSGPHSGAPRSPSPTPESCVVTREPTFEVERWEGERLIEGSFSSLRFDGRDEPVVTALETANFGNDSESVLAFVRYPTGERCVVGPADRYSAALWPDTTPREEQALVPFLAPATADAPVTLRFATLECDVATVELPGAELRLQAPFSNQRGLVAQTDDEVHYVDPWSGDARVLGRNAVPLAGGALALFPQFTGHPWMWMILDGEVVALDAEFDEVLRVGSGAETLVSGTSAGASAPVFAFTTTDQELFVMRESDEYLPQRLDQDACELSFPAPGLLLYYSPCEERVLVVWDLVAEARRVVASEVGSYRIGGVDEDGPVLLYVTNTDETLLGTLWVQDGDTKPVRVGDSANLGLSQLSEGELHAVVDYGDTGGRLVAGVPGQSLETIAEHVAYARSSLVIANYDGTSGDLFRFEQDRSLTLLLERVAREGLRFEYVSAGSTSGSEQVAKQRILALGDFDGETGTLNLIEGCKRTVLARNVVPNAYQPTVQLDGITVLHEQDGEVATLSVFDPAAERAFELSKDVSEAVEVAWPSPGFLYAGAGGGEKGIWFRELP